MFETVTPGISGHTAQAEPTAAAIAKRFSALAHRVISLRRSNSVAIGGIADINHREKAPPKRG